MRRWFFSKEEVSLFFILSLTLFFCKVLIDVKSIINIKINQLIPQPTIAVEYSATSLKTDELYDKLPELNVINNYGELKNFKEKFLSEKNEEDWLNKKLNNYKESDLKDKTLVILAVVNNDNVLTTRITSVTKKNNDVIITLNRTGRNKNYKEQYTWFAIIELKTKDNQVLLDIN